jgi:tRNA G18 (ribose-2'-O)-methylase SpoU
VTNADNPSPELTTWGVGPWQGEWPLDADGNLDPVLDPELLTNGDSRNVLDKYRYWKMEAIVADLDLKRHKFHVAIENWQHDLNIGSIVRTANAFLAAEVHIIGNKRWNRRGAMVTDRYQHVRHHPTVEDFVEWTRTGSFAARQLPIIAIDNIPGCQQIERYTLPEECVLLFGQEGPGLSDAAITASEAVLEITQFGSTRSINASAAAAIAMHSWVMTHVF